ncbi:MAG: hypothetical protein JXB48_06180 [Candidatus Latescibacteria bacterium]|nr:hypothetical protein [Candidatus Latescibacterota bacterium]
MFKSKWNIVWVLAACTLLLATTADAKKQVTRPLKIQSDATVVYTSDTTVMVTEKGEATHLGRFLSEGFGDIYSDNMKIHYLTDWIAANGDVLHWEGDVYLLGIVDNKVYFTMKFWIVGGTGRFEGASGDFGDETEVLSGDINPDGSITFSYKTSGIITY